MTGCQAPAQRAAFFDMDRTLLRIDSGMSWMRFLRRRGELSTLGLARAVYWSALYKLAVLDMETLAARLCADLEGNSEADMVAKCRVWYEADVAREVAPKARQSLGDHRRRGDVIVLATGATQFIAEVISESLNIDHTLCTRLQVKGGVFTGRLDTMCFGRHKVSLAERLAHKSGIDLAQSSFYSDSYNDLPMLERVGNPVAVNPDLRLRRHAQRRGWPIVRWDR